MPVSPIIISALFGGEDFAWLDELRKRHFPPERNHLDAHLTLFHHLPPSLESEIKTRLSDLARRPAPIATAVSLISLGRGVAVRVASSDLEAIRLELAEAFNHVLVPQDAARWRPHVTIQNKVPPAAARELLAQLEQDFRPCPIRISGLAAWWYRGGPWEPLSRHPFRGG